LSCHRIVLRELPSSQPFTIFSNPHIRHTSSNYSWAKRTLTLVSDICAKTLLMDIESTIWFMNTLTHIEKLRIFGNTASIRAPYVWVLIAKSWRGIEILPI
jgi:hypothetical protein